MPQSAKGCVCDWTAQASSSSGQGIHLASQTAVTRLTMQQRQPHVKITSTFSPVLIRKVSMKVKKVYFHPDAFFCKKPALFSSEGAIFSSFSSLLPETSTTATWVEIVLCDGARHMQGG